MSRRSGPSSGFILNKPCLNKRVQEINLRAGLAGNIASICLPRRNDDTVGPPCCMGT